MLARPALSLGIAGIALLAIGRADAAELCVRCTGPDASYACVVNTPASATPDTVVKLYCITALAKAGSHESCAIDRTSTAPCQGARKELPLPSAFDAGNDDATAPADTHGATSPAAKPPAAVAAPAQAPPETSPAGPPPPAKDTASDTPPKTVQEMIEKGTKSAGDGLNQTGKSAGEAAKTAGTALEKAGTAVSDAAKNSWKCLSSFFSNC